LQAAVRESSCELITLDGWPVETRTAGRPVNSSRTYNFKYRRSEWCSSLLYTTHSKVSCACIGLERNGCSGLASIATLADRHVVMFNTIYLLAGSLTSALQLFPQSSAGAGKATVLRAIVARPDVVVQQTDCERAAWKLWKK
jgi:hypothetical protein